MAVGHVDKSTERRYILMNENTATVRSTSKEIRAGARDSLKGKWGTAILLNFIFSLAMIVVYAVSGAFSNMGGPVGKINPVGAALAFVIAIGAVFVQAPLYIGLTSVFIKIADGDTPVANDLFSKFYLLLKATGTMFIAGIKVFLWSLLLFVPGIIASLNYSMAFYIMAEDDNVGSNEAIEISKAMMKGNKGKLFVLDLTFIGWGILSVLTFGIGYIFLAPYMNTARARFYRELSDSYMQNKGKIGA